MSLFGNNGTKINLKGFCIKCKQKTEMINPKLETTPTGKSLVKGACEKCGTNCARIVPPTTNQKDLINAVEEQKKEKILEEKEREKKEKEEGEKKVLEEKEKEKVGVDKFVQNSKKNDILKRNGIKVVKRNGYYKLFKIAIFLLAVIVAIFLYRTLYPLNFMPKHNNTNICECPECPNLECPECPSCDCSVICGNMNCSMPSELEIILKNDSG